ncbi:MAG TPA: hypothetical protein VFA29_09650 [Candidatus Baltobacteraceae bacterium]|nr:hypothetical protein [Candidatus Baltobacteraceae bacterium]
MHTTAIGPVLALSAAALSAAAPAMAASSALGAADVSSRAGSVAALRPGAPAPRAVAADTPAQNSISLEARQLQGAAAISVYGSAPPTAPVTITLLAVVSSEVPTIVVSRHDVVADVSGRFGAVIPIAPAFERGTILRIIATSLPGVGSASAQLVASPPNDGVDVPLEH